MGAGVEGSSPLARGLLATLPCCRSKPRIIPARAGFTPTSAPGACTTRDHPRSRGVYVINLSCAIVTGGSSPLARGLQRLRRR